MKKRLPSVVTIMILTSITAFFWVSFSIYRVFSQKKSVNIPPDVITVINPKLDTETLKEIERRSLDR